MVTNEFQNLGIQNQEIADLLFVPESTLRTWFKRATAIPSKYYGYILGLKIYNANQKAEDLITIYTKWETINRALKFIKTRKNGLGLVIPTKEDSNDSE